MALFASFEAGLRSRRSSKTDGLPKKPFARAACWNFMPARLNKNFMKSIPEPFFDLVDCPASVLRNQRFRICHGFFQGCECRLVADVAQRHTHVPQKATTFRAQHRCSLESQPKARLVQREQVDQLRGG